MLLYRLLEYLSGQYTGKVILPYYIVQKIKMLLLIYFIK